MDAYLTDTVTWTRRGADKWGKPLTPVSQTIKCRHKIGSTLTVAYQGQQVLASGSIIMRAQPGHADTFQIDGVDHPIVKLERLRQGVTVVGWRAWYK